MCRNLKECLEEQVRSYTQYSYCAARRMVFYMWDTTDEKAVIFCRALKKVIEAANVEVWPVSADSREKMPEVFRTEREKCRKRMEKTCWPACPRDTYILVVGTSPGIAKKLDAYARNAEFVRLTDTDVWEKSVGDEHFNCRAEWRIGKEDVGAAAALLMHAAYSDRLIRPESYDSNRYNVYGLKSREYHAAEETICSRFHTILALQMEASEYDMETLAESLGVKAMSSKAASQCMKPEWIPIVGHEELEENLKEQYPYKIVAYFKEDDRIRTDWTVWDILSVFQGKKDGIPGTEWLRKKVEEEELPFFCRRIAKSEKEDIKRILRKNISLHDLSCSLSRKLEDYSRQTHLQKKEAEKRIEEELKSEFVPKSLRIMDVRDGLVGYYQLWHNYMKICAEKVCLDEIKEIVGEMQTDAVRSRREIEIAKSALESLSIGFLDSKPKIKGEDFTGNAVWDEKSLMEAINGFDAYTEFSAEDIVKLQVVADSAYQVLGDMHVDRSRHPHIYLIYNEGIDVKENGDDCYFEWNRIPVGYIPKTFVRELRVYNIVLRE